MKTDEHIEDLQSTSSQIIADAELIRDLEEEKRHVDPSSDRFRELSSKIQATADDVDVLTDAEVDLAREVADEPDTPTIAQADAAKGGSEGPADRSSLR